MRLSCLLPNHISRVCKPVLDGTTWMGWGHTQSTDPPPASAASTWFPLHCCFFLLRAACFSVFVLEKGQVQYMASMATTVLTLLCFLPAIILAKVESFDIKFKIQNHVYLKHALPSPNTAALASRPTCLTVSRVKTSTSRKSRQTFPFFPENDVSICFG